MTGINGHARSARLPGIAGVGAVAFLVVMWAAQLQSATFTASLDRETITLGENAQLSLKFVGANPQDVPQVPQVPNLQIQYVGPSSQFSFIQGQVSSIVTHVFTVAPRQVGDYTIPAITVRLGPDTLTSQPLRLKVLKPGAPPPDAINSGAQLAFMKLILPKKEICLGETVVLELQLYFNSRLAGRGSPQLSSFPAEGLTLGKMTEGQARQVQIGNAVYSMVPVAVPVRATRTGPIKVGPVTASVVVELPSQGGRRGGLFEQFGFRDPFSGGEQRQVNMATDETTLTALALPTDAVPAEFNGAVGQFTLSVHAGPTNVAVGDPVTVKVQITGRGALESLTLPEQNWKDFKSYPPTAKVEATDPQGLRGTKTFEQVVVPENSEIKQLPPYRFSYFDPETKSYQTLTQPGLALVVRPVGAAAAPSVITANRGNEENAPPVRDIVHIKQRLGTVAQLSKPLILQPWFITAQSIPFLAWLGVIGWRKRAEALANNPRLRRQRQVAQTVKEGLENLRRHAAQNASDEFFGTLVRLLQEQLGERLDLPASAITEAVIEEHLRPRGIGEPLIQSLNELFQACNQARYAPVKSSEELAAWVPKLEATLKDLQGLKI